MRKRQFPLIGAILLFAAVLSAQETIHILRKGETLYSVARSYGVAYEELMRENAITDPRRLHVGQKIRIPGTRAPSAAPAAMPASAPVIHRVARGETFFGIAGRYGTTVAELRTENSLSEKHLLKEGEALRIPPNASKLPKPIAAPSQSNPAAAPGFSVPPVQVPSSPAGPVAAPPANLGDPRSTVAKSVDPAVRWPIAAKHVAYMTGKLYGVVVTGERSEPVRSLTQGTVVSAGPYRGFGRVAIVQAPGGYVYVYGGCESLSVKVGDRVAPGSELGRLGIDALSERPQLFFLVYKDNVAVDPATAPR